MHDDDIDLFLLSESRDASHREGRAHREETSGREQNLSLTICKRGERLHGYGISVNVFRTTRCVHSWGEKEDAVGNIVLVHGRGVQSDLQLQLVCGGCTESSGTDRQ